MKSVPVLIIVASLTALCTTGDEIGNQRSGNPVLEGWYADPEGVVLDNTYWIFPTYSAKYDSQVFFDAFSSKDLLTWKKHERVLDTSMVNWATRALWAPSVVNKEGMYYLFFGANDLQRPGGPLWNEDDSSNHTGGIGIAVSNTPGGPYEDYLGRPLISDFYNDAQPIDQFVFEDKGVWYIVYGGWGKCNIAMLKDDFSGVKENKDGGKFQDITPEGYVEGPVIFKRKQLYYFMWSEGSWGDDSYQVAYGISDKVTGPYKKMGVVLKSDTDIATGAGHNSVLNTPGTDDWYIVYHRRPIPNEGRDHRVTCIDKLTFDEKGQIKNVKMTHKGVSRNPL